MLHVTETAGQKTRANRIQPAILRLRAKHSTSIVEGSRKLIPADVKTCFKRHFITPTPYR